MSIQCLERKKGVVFKVCSDCTSENCACFGDEEDDE